MKEIETYFENISNVIISNLLKATYSIKVASSWFTNKEILKTLIDLKEKVAEIEIVVSNNEINRSNYWLRKLDENSVKIYFSNDAYKQGMMHHKFCVIDSRLVITGSYNWTNNATKNKENINIIYEEKNIKKYEEEFEKLKQEYARKIQGSNIEVPISEEQRHLNENLKLEVEKIRDILIEFIKEGDFDAIQDKDENSIKKLEEYLSIHEDQVSENRVYQSDIERAKKRLNLTSEELIRKEAESNYLRLKLKAIALIVDAIHEEIKQNSDEVSMMKAMHKLQNIINQRNKIGRELGIVIMK